MEEEKVQTMILKLLDGWLLDMDPFVRLIKIFRCCPFEKEIVDVNIHIHIFSCIILKDS